MAALRFILTRRKCAAGFALAVLTALASGCSTRPLTDPIIGPNYQVSNVFRKEAMLPAQVRRVAVLPVNLRQNSALLIAGRESLESVFWNELTKAGRFELVMVQPVELKQWTGREQWDSYDALPQTILKTLADKTGAEAVLFPTLTEYKPYPPITIGWRMKLAGSDADILWAVEEIFDASEQGVSNAARRFDRDHVRSSPVLEDSRSILLSPKRFGKYTLDALLETLPTR